MWKTEAAKLAKNVLPSTPRVCAPHAVLSHGPSLRRATEGGGTVPALQDLVSSSGVTVFQKSKWFLTDAPTRLKKERSGGLTRLQLVYKGETPWCPATEKGWKEGEVVRSREGGGEATARG